MGQPGSKLPKEKVRALQRKVSFSEKEIQDWWREFLRSARRTAGKGRFLTEQEFVQVYNSVYPGDGHDFAHHIFRTFDKSGNGHVDFHEFLIGMYSSGSTKPETRLRWAFELYDINQTGFITKKDMEEIIRSVMKMLNPALSSRDSGYAETMANDLFGQLDRNRNSRISWDEFRDGAMRCSLVVDLLQCAPPGEDDEVFQ
ncbi:neurocalcin-delta-like isoform X2 [Pomacea canaliculata]|nr:neurocalcin-delta-like isoform X2 [Pomacea canaliculata]XP_025111551.1 neurocalcin-delta-like isoform X2 [Pomacea canaliculata]